MSHIQCTLYIVVRDILNCITSSILTSASSSTSSSTTSALYSKRRSRMGFTSRSLQMNGCCKNTQRVRYWSTGKAVTFRSMATSCKINQSIRILKTVCYYTESGIMENFIQQVSSWHNSKTFIYRF